MALVLLNASLVAERTQKSETPTIIASNRGPIEHYLTEAGSIRQRNAGGGVAVALRSVADKMKLTWVAAACGFADQIVARTGRRVPIGGQSSLRLLALPEQTYEPYYRSFCNPLLWFVQHSLGENVHPSHTGDNALRAWRDGYEPVNRAFADAVNEEIDVAGGRANVMLHDYHLYLVARMIRAAHPGTVIQQFIHIPWPEPEAWAEVPAGCVAQICRGLLGNDSLAFQDDDSVERFKDTCAAYLGSDVTVSRHSPHIAHGEGSTYVWTNPISVDVAELTAPASIQPAPAAAAGDLRTILRVDRLDPSKNVLRGFEAYEALLARRTDLHGKVRFVACLVPSRDGISEYDDYVTATFELVESINQRYGTPDWQPVTVLHEQNRPQALAWMESYDVLLVNSVADGMNLVCKEGVVVNKNHGSLVLSRRAGAHRELKHSALSIDPLDVTATSEALEQALDMPADERKERAARLLQSVLAYQLSDWLRALLKDLELNAHEKASAATR